MQLIPAVKKDESLIAEMDSFLGDKDHFHIWWLGQSGYLLQWKGERVLIDPYLSDSLTKKYADTKKPHVRMSERVLNPSLLKNISIVSSSHNHTDHLDGETLIPVIQNNPGIKFIIPEANRAFACERVKCASDFPIGLNDGRSVRIGSFSFHGIPAKHNEIDRDENGNCRYMGYVIEFGRWKIYHSGDTLWFPEMESLLKPYKIDLALLPVNGNDPSRGVAGNLDAKEAVHLAKSINAGCVIPCHYHMFLFNTADPELFIQEAKLNEQSFVVLQHGERWSSQFLTNE
jgi:L-ascorbate metabolism protein UlaG (beta-lactamase superfamily)